MVGYLKSKVSKEHSQAHAQGRINGETTRNKKAKLTLIILLWTLTVFEQNL